MTIKNKKDLSSSIEQLEKAINQQETILKKFDNEQLDFEQIKKLENLLIQEREKAKHLTVDETEQLLQIFANMINKQKPDKYKKKFRDYSKLFLFHYPSFFCHTLGNRHHHIVLLFLLLNEKFLKYTHNLYTKNFRLILIILFI